MAITTLNSLAIPAGTVVSADLTYPLTGFSSTGIDDNATSTAITIDSSENVGIGETTPSTTLTKASITTGLVAEGTVPGFCIQDTSGADNAGYWFQENGTMVLQNYGTGNTVFRTGSSGTETVRIDSSGNVGIGITNPAADLVVAGSSSGEYDALILRNSSGVDTSSTSITFEVSGGTHGTEGATAAKISALREGGGTTGALLFHTTSSGTSAERMRIDSSGNVGIGTASPVVSSGYNSLTINDTTSGYLVLQNNGTTKMEAYVSGGTEATLRGTGVPLAFVTTAAHEMTFDTNATERMRIDSSGNVGIGVAPVAGYGKKLQVHSAAGGGASVHITDSVTGSTASDGLELITFNSAAYIWNREASFMSFGTSATERMRIDSSGNLLVGKTTTALTTAGVALLPNGELYVTRDSGATAYFNREGSDGDVIVIRNDNVTVGSISVSGSTTSYNPSSDVRLKENIRDYDNALADVMKLKPRKYSWKTDGAEDSGFIAQELMETPEFANRVNPIDDDSDDPMYGVDYMKFVAVLTGAIQEQQAMIETLQAEVAALKGA
jgi:hypothetical protein